MSASGINDPARTVRTLTEQEAKELSKLINVNADPAAMNINCNPAMPTRKSFTHSSVDRPLLPRRYRYHLEPATGVGSNLTARLVPSRKDGRFSVRPMLNTAMSPIAHRANYASAEEESSTEYMPSMHQPVEEQRQLPEDQPYSSQPLVCNCKNAYCKANDKPAYSKKSRAVFRRRILTALQKLIPGNASSTDRDAPFENEFDERYLWFRGSKIPRDCGCMSVSSWFLGACIMFSCLLSVTSLILIIFGLSMDHSATRLWNGITTILLGLQWIASGPYSLQLCSVRRLRQRCKSQLFATLKNPKGMLNFYHVANWLVPKPHWPTARTTLGVHSGFLASVLSLIMLILHTTKVLNSSFDIIHRPNDPNQIINVNSTLTITKYTKNMSAVLLVYKCAFVCYAFFCYVANMIVLLGLFNNLRSLTLELRRVAVLFLIDASILERQEAQRLVDKLQLSDRGKKKLEEETLMQTGVFKEMLENIDEDESAEEEQFCSDESLEDHTENQSPPQPNNTGGPQSNNATTRPIDRAKQEEQDPVSGKPLDQHFSTVSGKGCLTNRVFQRFCELSCRGAPLKAYSELTMSDTDVTQLHWRLQRRMTLTSNALQRWLVSWILFVALWSMSYIVDWLKPPKATAAAEQTFQDSSVSVALLLGGILLIWLLVSSYAEVNSDVDRLMRSVYPVDGSRLTFLRLAMPNKGTQALQVGLFGLQLTHMTVVTVALALGITVSARIVWAEISRNLN